MASHVFSGTASGHLDLLTKIVAHLTNAGTLGADVWTLLTSRVVDGQTERYLAGPGSAGADSIHVNISAYQDVGADFYNFRVRGAIAHNPALPFDTQPGQSPETHLLLWQSAIPYRLIVNGRRFIIIAKVSTVYSNGYYGFMLPYATSSEMPYPMFIGGNSSAARRWSSDRFDIGAFFDPPDDAAYVRHFDGHWLNVANYSKDFDYRSERSDSNVWPWEKDFKIGRNQDGTYGLLPAVVHANYSSGNVYGELQGVNFASGFGNASENILQVAGKDYFMAQSSNRTSRRDYAAILLE